MISAVLINFNLLYIYIIMKNLSLKVTQNIDGLNNEFTQLIEVSNENFDTLIGTALNRLFEYQTTLATINDKGRFRCNAPMTIEIESENTLISTDDILSETSKEGLKIGNTAKGKKRFARKIYLLLQFAYSEAREVQYTELVAELEAEIASI